MKIKTLLKLLLCILLTGTVAYAAPKQDVISMTIPATVVKNAITKSLPVNFDINSSTLLGSIFIEDIKNLQFTPGKLSSHISISGRDMRIVTSIAGHDLRMKIGTLSMSFQCEATIRFDATSQTLFLKPVVSDLQSSENKKADVASAIVLLFNNREFAFPINKLNPLETDTGSKLLTISMDIADIKLQKDSLLLTITPTVEATTKSGKAALK